MQSDSQSIMDSLRRLVQALRQSSAHFEDRSNITGAQALVLKHIAGRDGLSVNDLAGLTFTHQSTVSEVVSRLEGRGLVQRLRSPEDGRKCVLRLTPEGCAVAKGAAVTAQEKLMQALQGLSPETTSPLAAGLRDLISAAGLAHEAPVMFFEAHSTTKAEPK